jgi:hypothetical protein
MANATSALENNKGAFIEGSFTCLFRFANGTIGGRARIAEAFIRAHPRYPRFPSSDDLKQRHSL